MSSGAEGINFREIARIVGESRSEQNVKQFCTKSSIIPLNDFYSGLQDEINDINSQITPIKEKPSILDFASALKSFEAYPANLAKPKKLVKDSSRGNFSTSKEGTTVIEGSRNINRATIPERGFGQTGLEIYQDFIKFEKKLKHLLEQLKNKELENECTTKAQFINSFAQQIEKLLNSNNGCNIAFNNQEEQKLRRIVQDINNLCALQNNHDIFKDVNDDEGTRTDRLESLLEVISHALVSISFFNVF